MTTKPDDGGPAFPVMWSEQSGIDYSIQNVAVPGMSLRDWFAGQAMNGFIIRIDVKLATDETEKLAADSYAVADAMLKARQS